MPSTWLVAHDLTGFGDTAAFDSARLLDAAGGHMTLLHVFSPEHLDEREQTGERMFQTEEKIRGELEVVARNLRELHPRIKVDVATVAGSSVACILEEADRLGAERIVVGTHSRTGVPHLLLGSVAEQIVHRAKVPVHVIKPRKEA